MTENDAATVPTPLPFTPSGFSHREAVQRLASAMRGGISPGEKAQLRRLDPRSPSGGAFWRALVTYVEPFAPLGENPAKRAERETAWAAILKGMAKMDGLHRPGMRLGRALSAAGFSELRFTRLLRADGPALIDELTTVTHYLMAKGSHVDWVELAELLLLRGDEPAERLRRRIARDFYSPPSVTIAKENSP